jgi:3-oxoacyl-[acyl-carrier-protein] synthase II
MEAQNRVVVTGMGIVSPIGIGLDAFWDSLINCKSGIGPITLFDTTGFKVKIAGEVRNFDLRNYFGKECRPNRLARQTQLGLVACKMAIEHAGLTKEMLKACEPVAMVLGISSGASDIIERAKETIMTHGASRVRPVIGACQPHAIGSALVQLLGTQATVSTLSNACPSGLDAVGAATQMIKSGRADLVIAGAADSPLTTTGVAGFAAVKIPSLSSDFPPEEVSRPFDLKRSGVVLSEGAGFVVLERLDVALARGAEPIIEILGGAAVTDAPGFGNMEGLFQTMSLATTNAGINLEQVDYICANATSDREGDKIETDLIKTTFGKRAYQIPISSIRGVMGHSLAPSSVAQVIACALTMKHQIISPTANLTNPDPECDLDYVPLKPRNAKVNIAMANSHGIGGENSTLIMKNVS